MNDARRARLVVVTHADADGSPLVARLESAGVRVWRVPVVAHEPAADVAAIDAALARLAEMDWVVFTSARAVEAVCDRPAWRTWMAAGAAGPRVAAVGPSTSTCLAEHRVRVAVCPSDAGAAGLARAIVGAEGGTLEGRTVLWPRSEIARPELRDALVAAQARLIDPVAYRTLTARPGDLGAFLRDLREGRIDAVTFMSPSSAQHMAAFTEDGTLSILPDRTIVASVGPSTSSVLAGLGAAPAVEADEHTGSGLASALLGYFGHHEGVMS